MKPSPFEYRAPETLNEAVALLAADSGAKVLAGGQSLIPVLAFRLATPSLLVDLRRLPGAARRQGALARLIDHPNKASERRSLPGEIPGPSIRFYRVSTNWQRASGFDPRRVHWVKPELVAEVKFLTWTDDNVLRQVVYEGSRDDKPASEVRRPVPHAKP